MQVQNQQPAINTTTTKTTEKDEKHKNLVRMKSYVYNE